MPLSVSVSLNMSQVCIYTVFFIVQEQNAHFQFPVLVSAFLNLYADELVDSQSQLFFISYLHRVLILSICLFEKPKICASLGTESFLFFVLLTGVISCHLIRTNLQLKFVEFIFFFLISVHKVQVDLNAQINTHKNVTVLALKSRNLLVSARAGKKKHVGYPYCFHTVLQ